MNWSVLIKAIVAQLPSMVELGVNLFAILPELKKSVEAVAGRGEITAADAADIRAKIADAEAAWQVQVNQAQSELDAEAKKG